MTDDELAAPPLFIVSNGIAARPSEGQCDACPPGVTSLPLTSAPAPPDRYSLPATLTTARLDDHHWMAYAPGASAGPAVLNDRALALLRRFEYPLPLYAVRGEAATTGALAKMRQARLLVPETCPAPSLKGAARTLTAWLHLTTACNLRCAYCYLPHDGGEMSPRVGRQAVDAVFRSALAHGFSTVKFKYAGGEPTLRFPLLAELHTYAGTLAARHGLELDGVVLSNGVALTPHMIETMLSLRLRLAISLDGLGPHHDCQRSFPDGRGSFDAVAHAVDRALAAGLVPDISITVSGRSAEGLPALMAWVLERGLPFNLNFYRESDRSAPERDLRLEEERIIGGMLAAYEVVEERLPQRCLLASLTDRANLAAPHARACSVGDSYLVIGPRGHIAKCQMDMAHVVSGVRADDPLADVRADEGGIQNLPVDEREGCCDCAWRAWCGGGCPLETYRATGRWNARSPHCNIYRALFPQVLRLEGLRLLRYAGDTLAC